MNAVETFKRLKEIAPDTQVIMVTAVSVEDLIIITNVALLRLMGL